MRMWVLGERRKNKVSGFILYVWSKFRLGPDLLESIDYYLITLQLLYGVTFYTLRSDG